MKRSDRVRLNFTRNWKLPGKERFSQWFKPSGEANRSFSGGIVWLTDEDVAIYTTADNFIEQIILTTGTYEDEINKPIRLSLKPGNVALDIGANIGLQSLRMSQCVGPQGSVIAFEPLEYLRNKFNRNMALNKVSNVKLMPYALSDQESSAEFKINPATWNQGAFSIAGKDDGTELQKVDIKVGDDLPEIRSLLRLDLIKIDVEGFEFQVMKGLKTTLEKFRPRIVFEYDMKYWPANGQSISECFDFLRKLDYEIYQVNPACSELRNSAMEIEDGNVFCINNQDEKSRL